MFGFLGFILIFILLIVFVVIALLGNLVRAIFGIGKRTPMLQSVKKHLLLLN